MIVTTRSQARFYNQMSQGWRRTSAAEDAEAERHAREHAPRLRLAMIGASYRDRQQLEHEARARSEANLRTAQAFAATAARKLGLPLPPPVVAGDPATLSGQTDVLAVYQARRRRVVLCTEWLRDPTTDDAAVRAIVAHELAHALQFAQPGSLPRTGGRTEADEHGAPFVAAASHVAAALGFAAPAGAHLRGWPHDPTSTTASERPYGWQVRPELLALLGREWDDDEDLEPS